MIIFKTISIVLIVILHFLLNLFFNLFFDHFLNLFLYFECNFSLYFSSKQLSHEQVEPTQKIIEEDVHSRSKDKPHYNFMNKLLA